MKMKNLTFISIIIICCGSYIDTSYIQKRVCEEIEGMYITHKLQTKDGQILLLPTVQMASLETAQINGKDRYKISERMEELPIEDKIYYLIIFCDEIIQASE